MARSRSAYSNSRIPHPERAHVGAAMLPPQVRAWLPLSQCRTTAGEKRPSLPRQTIMDDYAYSLNRHKPDSRRRTGAVRSIAAGLPHTAPRRPKQLLTTGGNEHIVPASIESSRPGSSVRLWTLACDFISTGNTALTAAAKPDTGIAPPSSSVVRHDAQRFGNH
jgi:hypothetical protein